MSEKIKFRDVVNMDRDFFSAFMMGCITDGKVNIKDLNIIPETTHLDIELKINGIEIPIKPFVESIESQLHRMTNEAATKLILDKFKERSSRIQDILHGAERSLKDELQKVGLLEEEYY